MKPEKSSGLEVLLASVGRAPVAPFEQQLAIRLTQAGEGHVQFEACPTAEGANASGAMHGGWIAGVLDAVSGAAVQTVLRPGETYTTLSLQINYLRAVYPGHPVRIEGQIIRAGKRIVTAEASLSDAKGPLAISTASCLRLEAAKA